MKKVIALLLTAVMVIGMIPASALAESAGKMAASEPFQLSASQKELVESQLYEEPVTYRVTFTYENPETKESIILEQEVNVGSEPIMPVVPNFEGYAFNGWVCGEDGNYTGSFTRLGFYTVEIEYVYTDGTAAYAPFIEEVPYDRAESYRKQVPSPVLDGFTADRDSVVLEGITEDTKVTVTYTGTVAVYTVKHMKQNLACDGYDVVEIEVVTGQLNRATTAEAKAQYTEGFTAQPIVNVALDRTEGIVVEVKYDRNGYRIFVDSDGGSVLAPIEKLYGQSLTDLEQPTRLGYRFVGYVLENGDSLPETMPANDLSVKALWADQESAAYRVVYWQEKVPAADEENGSGYDYVEEVTGVAQVGTEVAAPARSYTGFTKVREDENVTVLADGTAVKNVYFDRNTYTIKFYNGRTEMTDLRITAKYGKDVSALWNDEAHSKYSWATTRTHQNVWYTLIANMPAEDITVYADELSTGTYILYETETLTSGVYEEYARFEAGSNVNLTEEDKQPIDGFTFSSWSKKAENRVIGTEIVTKTGCNCNETHDEHYSWYRCPNWGPYEVTQDKIGRVLWLRYTRNTYSVTYENCESMAPTSLKFEEVMTAANKGNALPPATVESDYAFGGWYLSPACEDGTEVNWNATMPSHNVQVFAKWIAPVYTVTFDVNGVTPAEDAPASVSLPKHTSLDTLPTLSAEGFIFQGWYSDPEGRYAFDPATEINKDWTLYAKWQRSQSEVSYTITYVDMDGNPILDEHGEPMTTVVTVTDTSESTINIVPVAPSGYLVVGDGFTVNLNVADPSVKIPCVKAEGFTYRVIYQDEEGNVLDQEEKYTENNQVVVIYKAIEGYTLVDTDNYVLITKPADDTQPVAVFTYAAIPHPTYRVEYYKQLVNGTYASAPDEVEYSESGTVYNVGDRVIAEKKTYEGFRFSRANPALSMQLVDGENVIKLYYARIPVTVTYMDNKVSKTTVETQNLLYGATYITSTKLDGVKDKGNPPTEFFGWTTDASAAKVDYSSQKQIESLKNSGTFFESGVTLGPVTKDVTYYAVWARLSLSEKLEIQVASATGSWEYDGSVHTAFTYTVTADGKEYPAVPDENGTYIVTLTSGDRVVITPNASAKVRNVADGTVDNAFTYLVTDSNGYLLNSDNYTLKPDVVGTLTVTPRAVSVTAENKEKAFGEADPELTAFVTGTLSRDTVEYTLERTPGEAVENSPYAIIPSGDKNQGNYTVTFVPGTLTIRKAGTLTVSGTNYTGIYDGNSHGQAAVANVTDGTTVSYSTDGGENWTTNVPSVTHVADSVTVMVKAENPNYETATASYTLTVTPRSVILTSGTASKTYDRYPLTEDSVTVSGQGFVGTEGADYDVTGSQTDVGTSENLFTYVLKDNTKADDYTVTVAYGELEVIRSGILSVKGIDYSGIYDGASHGTAAVTNVTEGTTVSYSTDGGETWSDQVPSVTNVTDSVSVTVKAENTNYETATATYSLTVTRRPVTLTSASGSKLYDGTALTDASVTVSGHGFVNGEGADCDVTGTQTLVGTSDNSFTYTLTEDTLEENYTVTTVFGTLTVTDRNEEEFVSDELVVTKTHDETKTYALGDTVTFTIRVKNIYDAVKTITVTEQDGVTITGQSVFTDVAPGAEVETTATYTVTEEDILRGSFDNTASVAFSDVDHSFTGEDTVDEIEAPKSILTLEKETTNRHEDGSAYALGEKITYTVTVRNDGNLTLTDVVVTDELTDDKWEIASLAPGEEKIYETSHVVTEADVLAGYVLNAVTASCVSPDSEPTVAPADTKDVVESPRSNLTLIKETTNAHADGTPFALGETITYSVTVRNDGNLTLTDVVVTDELTGDEWEIESLAPGEKETYETSHVVTEADVLAGSVLNEVVATGVSPDPEHPRPAVLPGSTEDEVEAPRSILTLTKETTNAHDDGTPFALGDTITYSVTVRNDGNLTLTNVVVTDELTADEWVIESLAPGEEETYETSYVVTEADVLAGFVQNEAVVSGTTPDPAVTEPVEADGDVKAPVETGVPSIFVEKTIVNEPANGSAFAPGETISYRITVTNNGNVTVNNITVEDKLEGVVLENAHIDSLAPGESAEVTATYVVTEADLINGKIVNEATAAGTAATDEVVGDSDSEECDLVPMDSTLNVTKTVTSTPANGRTYALGETVSYKITVNNNGNVTLTHVVVADLLTGDTWTVDTLAPGASETFVTSHQITEADILAGKVVNSVTASGTDVAGEETEDEAAAEVLTDAAAPALALHKTVDTDIPERGFFTVGETIRYTVTVINTGNVTLTDVVVTDDITGDKWTVATLGVGETKTFNTSYVVLEKDTGTDGIINTAVASAKDPDGKDIEPVSDSTEAMPVAGRYTLSVYYVYLDGAEAAPAVIKNLYVGEQFLIYSPEIADYEPNTAFVTGAMPAADVNFIITYVSTVPPATDPAPSDPAPSDPAPSDPAPSDPAPSEPAPSDPTPPVEVEIGDEPTIEIPSDPTTGLELDPDNLTVIPITPEEIPLENLDLDGHVDCIMHFLLILTALVVYCGYTSDRKKYQKRIQELTEELAMEKMRRGTKK